MAQQEVRYIWIMAIFLVLSFSASWAGVHTHIPRGINAANDTVEVDAGDTFMAASADIDTAKGAVRFTGTVQIDRATAISADIDSAVLILQDTTVTGVSVYRMIDFNLRNPNQLGKFVPAGGGKQKLVSAYDDYRMQERNTSIVRTEGKTHPDWGVKIITTGKDSLVTVDGSNHTRPLIFVGGASNAILDATPVMTSISTQDGRDWVSGTGGTDWTLIDWMADAAYQWDTANYSQYKGTLTNRNAGSGWLALATSPVIVNASVNDGDVIRSPWPIHRDQVGMQLAYWGIGTSGGVSVDSWNNTSTISIFDSGDTANSILLLDDGSILSIQDDATKDNLHWTYRTQSITADTWTQSETWSNAGTGSEDLRWGNTVVMSDVAAIPGASSAGRNSPRIMVGSDAGVAILDAKAGDNTNGAKAYIDAGFSTSLLYGNVHLAFSPASSANLGNIPAIFSTAETAVTRSATPSGPTSHSWAFNGTTSVNRVPDHDSLSFGDGSTDEAFSIMIWVNQNGLSPSENVLLSKRHDPAGQEFIIHYSATGYIYFVLIDNSTGGTIGKAFYIGSTLNNIGWHLYVFTYNGSSLDSGIQIYLNAVARSLAVASSGSYTAMENTTTPFLLGAYLYGGAYKWYLPYLVTAPIIVRGIIPESVIKEEYARGIAAIQSPTTDVLTSSNVLRVKASEDGKYWGVLNASRLEVRDVHGAWIDTFACTACGTLADFVFAPVPTDSFGVVFGGSTGYRAVIPDVRIEALAQAEWPDHSVIFDEGSVSVDSAGYGDFWRYSDASAALGIVAQPQEIRHLSNPDSSRYRAKFISVKDTLIAVGVDSVAGRLSVAGRTNLGNASTDSVVITADSIFVTDNAKIGLAGIAGRIEFDDQTTDEINFLDANVGIGVEAIVNRRLSISDSGVLRLRLSSTGGNLMLELDPSGAFGDIAFITADGADSKNLRLGGGGDVTTARGAVLQLSGNEATAKAGDVILSAGGTGNQIELDNGRVLVSTSAAPTNAEMRINGELVIGDAATDNNHDLRINAGGSYSEIDAGEAQFAVSSLSDLKTAIKPLVDVTSLRSVFRDSTTVKTWQWKRETLYQQRIVEEIMADSLRVLDLVLKEVVKREKIQVDTDTTITAWVDTLVSISSRDSVIALAVIDSLGEVVTSTKIVTYYDTLQIYKTRFDTTLTPILYTVTSPERRTIADSIRTAIVSASAVKVAAYNARIDAKANRQHIGIMAEDAYRIARIIAPEAAEPNVVDGNIIQAALVQMAIAHERELDSLKTVISALQNRVDALQIDLDARLKILEAK